MKDKKSLMLFVSSILWVSFCYSQAIDYSPFYRDLNNKKSFRFSYENDFFSASDRDYTQGAYLELIHENIGKFFVSRILWHPIKTNQHAGVAVETDGYTPNLIDRPEVQRNDRPYASTLLVKVFNSGKNSNARAKITNTLTVGVLGPLAGGKEIQQSIHRWIGYTKPLGWHNQIRNEPVINYQLNTEKALAGNNKNLLLTAIGFARAGNLSTKAAGGFALMVGKFPDPFQGNERPHGAFNIYLYEHAMVNVVGFDATLQGGLFNNSSPYTIDNSELNRLVLHNRVGVVVSFKTIMLEYWQSFMTREFKTGIEPKTGGLQIAFRLN